MVVFVLCFAVLWLSFLSPRVSLWERWIYFFRSNLVCWIVVSGTSNQINGTQCMYKRWRLTAISKIVARKLEQKQTNWCLNVITTSSSLNTRCKEWIHALFHTKIFVVLVSCFTQKLWLYDWQPFKVSNRLNFDRQRDSCNAHTVLWQSSFSSL